MTDLTQILSAIEQGGPHVATRLRPLESRSAFPTRFALVIQAAAASPEHEPRGRRRSPPEGLP
jgi:hypothetical protein